MRFSSARMATARHSGFGLASQFYFGKPLSELDLSEVALLVSIVRGPSYYDPRRHPDRARVRRDLVLKLMAERGITAPAMPLSRRSRWRHVARYGWLLSGVSGFCPAHAAPGLSDEDLTEAGLRIYTSLEPRAQDQAEHALERELERLDHQQKYPDAKLEGAVVVTAPQSGEVIAIVGSRNVGYDGFNRALDATTFDGLARQAVHLSHRARNGRYNAATIVQDAPVGIKLANGTVWRPENFTKQTYGPVPVVRALAESLNLATVGVGMDVGLSKVSDTLQRFGLERPPAQVPSMLFGAIDITPMEVAQLYNGLANGGFRSSTASRAGCHQRGQQAPQSVSAGGDSGRFP